MKKILTAITAITFLASCQKEISFDTGDPGNGGGNGGGGGGNTSGLLVKTVAKTGTETVTTNYSYDAQKRLEIMDMKGTSGGLPADSYMKYERDAAGRIVRTKQKLADLLGVPSDTAIRTVHYPNGTTMDFDYTIHVMSIDMGGGFVMSTIDSAVYTYSGGNMTSYHSYMSSSLMPGQIMSESKTDFTYDASGKVIKMKSYNAAGPGAPMELIADYTYTYATSSINNLYITTSGAQNFIIGGLPNTSTNVMTKMEMVSNATSPPLTVITTTTYVNGAGNKPVSGTVVAKTTGQADQTTNYTFFYQ